MLTRYLIQLTDPEEAWRSRVSTSCPLTLEAPKPQLPVELRIINIDRQTGKQFIIKLSSENNRRRGVTITFLHGCSNEADHSAVGVGKVIPTHSIVTYRCEWNIGLPMGYHD